MHVRNGSGVGKHESIHCQKSEDWTIGVEVWIPELVRRTSVAAAQAVTSGHSSPFVLPSEYNDTLYPRVNTERLGSRLEPYNICYLGKNEANSIGKMSHNMDIRQNLAGAQWKPSHRRSRSVTRAEPRQHYGGPSTTQEPDPVLRRPQQKKGESARFSIFGMFGTDRTRRPTNAYEDEVLLLKEEAEIYYCDGPNKERADTIPMRGICEFVLQGGATLGSNCAAEPEDLSTIIRGIQGQSRLV
ncbi:hypothetical protein B0H19DRAFT_1060522 [Mycena capillaripes]|nr:hypothetical protein B0H19DRAFT_1060522 [Mycena capillaripes]